MMDMVNAQPTIIYNATPEYRRWDFKHLMRYAVDRGGYFRELKQTPGCEGLKDCHLKSLMFLVLFGGSYAIKA